MPFEIKTVSVIGLGYIGLPTAATLASRGLSVIGVDVNDRIIGSINAGCAHFPEPELDMLLKAAVTTGRLRAVTRPEPADAFIIAVPTPFAGDHQPDLSYVDAAADSIAPVLTPGNVIILESTSPVGTTARLTRRLAAARPDLQFPLSEAGQETEGRPDIHVAHCPERILPGQMIRELVENDRVIGGITEACAARARDVYRTFVRGKCFLVDAATAEMIKLTENAYRDVNIAFANELSLICDRLGLNVWEVIELANRHPRVSILSPGPGVGGHCIAVDPWFLVASAPDLAGLIRTAREVNERKPDHVIDQVVAQANRFRNPVIACLGLAYKPNVDDLRESPALRIVQRLAQENLGTLLVSEPHIRGLPEALRGFANVDFCEAASAVQKADIVLVLVKHDAFRRLSPEHILKRAVIDTTGLWHSRLLSPPSED